MKQAAITFTTICLAFAHAGCHEAPAARKPAPPIGGPSTEPTVEYTGQDLEGIVGRRVRATGIAQNAKFRGIILPADYPLYVDGVMQWPPSLVGKTIEVTGTVDRIPPPPPGAGGIPGGGIILRDARWRRVEDAPRK